MRERISIAGLDKALVLKALFDRAVKPRGMMPAAVVAAAAPESLAVEELRCWLDDIAAHGARMKFDYINGRVLKVDLSGDDFDPGLYDRDNGDGAAKAAIDAIRI